MKKIIIIISTLLLASISIFAQQSNTQITEIDYFNALRYTGARNIARTTEGYPVVVFEPASGYTNQEIWYAIYNSAFQSWDVAQLSNSSTGSTGVPAVVADEDGAIHASWKERRSSSSGERSLMYSKLTFQDEFTYTWSTPERADTFTHNNPGVNTINLDSYGNPFMLYSIWNKGDVYNANIYATKNVDGTWSTDNLTAVFPTPNKLPLEYMDINLATGKDGEMFAAWEDKPTEIVNQYEILFSHYLPDSGWTEPEIVTPIFDGVGSAGFVDGYTPVDGAVSVYKMGPADYTLADQTSVLYNETATSKSIVSSFNPFYQSPEEDQQQYLKDVINFFGVTASDSILLVDDDNRHNNENIIQSAIETLGIPYRTFDCGNNGGMATNVPTYSSDMQGKKLVIWFTGDDYVDLAFWNIADTLNEELKTYMDNAGAQLFVVGRGWIDDRYSTDTTFIAGNFVHDYLGINSYNVQSKADDKGVGVPQLDKVDNTLGVSTIETIGWKNKGTRQGVPSIATDPDYKLHMVYQDDSDKTIKYQTYSDGIWSDAIRIDASADTILVTRPNISIDPNFGVYVIWRQETARINGKKIYNIFYRTSPDGGVTWNDPVQLSTTDYMSSNYYSTYRATIGIKVRKPIDGKFTGGADVVWVQASEASSLGYYIMYGNIPYVGTLTDVEDTKQIPLKFELEQNYPNPFNPTTYIKFALPFKSKVNLKIYNILGKEVATLVNNKLSDAGNYSYRFDASNLASGTYIYRLTTGNNVVSKKMLLLK